MSNDNGEQTLLSHHVQQELCTTRLPYRQGRKLTAVKVYTINNESNHLLIFGVPTLNLRQEAKSLFAKFGKLLQFNITKHESEQFTETYHARFERIQSARIAKKMLDTKNFYGGSLHVCYAPEFETIDETRQKLAQRKQDVLYRLRKLQNDVAIDKNKIELDIKTVDSNPSQAKLNMGEINTINLSGEKVISTNKRRIKYDADTEKRFKPCFINENSNNENNDTKNRNSVNEISISNTRSDVSRKISNDKLEVVDCTSVDNEVVTNINDSLNYKNFGNEIIRKLPEKPVNVIRFNIANENS